MNEDGDDRRLLLRPGARERTGGAKAGLKKTRRPFERRREKSGTSPICSPSERIVHLNLQRRCSRNAGAPSRVGGAARISPHFNPFSQKTNKRRRKELNYGW